MTSQRTQGLRHRAVLWAYPARFRRLHGRDLQQSLADALAAEPARGRRLTLVADAVAQGIAMRLELARWQKSRLPQKRGSLMDRMLQDIGYGARSLLHAPGATVVVVLTLALGIGANTAIFGLLNAVALRPLPLAHPDRLYQVQERNIALGQGGSNIAYPNLADLIEQAESVAIGGGYSPQSINVTGPEFPERATGALVAGQLFATLDMPALQGRLFVEADHHEGAPAVIVVSEGFWRDRLGGGDIVGTTLRVNSRPRTVVGVTTELLTEPVDVFVPLTITADSPGRENHFLTAVVRLAPDVTESRFFEEASAVAAALQSEHPTTNGGWEYAPVLLHDALIDNGWVVLTFLLGIVATVLLIACANVTNVMLARATAREREIAVRAAIGAGRARIVRQLLTESLLLAAVGSLAGLLVAAAGMRILRTQLADSLARVGETALDGRVLLFTLGIGAATGLLVGLAPALRASGVSLTQALKEGSSQGGGPRGGRLRQALVIAQISAAATLLLVAGMLMRTLLEVVVRDPGFEPANRISMRLDLPFSRYPPAALAGLSDGILGDALRVPGVNAAALTSQIPMAPSRTFRSFKLDEAPLPTREEAQYGAWASVTPGYFRLLGMDMRSGRGFLGTDSSTDEPVIVVNATLARTLFGDDSALGRRVHIFSDEDTARVVVGVVADTADRPFNPEATPAFYTPLAQAYSNRLALVLEVDGSATEVVAGMREAIRRIDADLPVYQIQTLDQVVAASSAGPRGVTTLVGSFAVVALSLSIIGLYGVIAYTVSRRTREIGVRVALGADSRRIRRAVVGDGLRLAAVSLPLAGAAGFAAMRVVRNAFRSIETFDPLTYGAVVVVTLLAVLVASYVPAVRATRVDPLTALRAE